MYSGKAHPRDLQGKALIGKVLEASKQHPQQVVFLENYDMKLGALLTRGVDVWLNNPRRPLEASGTSGMKAAMNGVPNLSILDGWWPEGCEHGVTGWKIGDADPRETRSTQGCRAIDQRISTSCTNPRARRLPRTATARAGRDQAGLDRDDQWRFCRTG